MSRMLTRLIPLLAALLLVPAGVAAADNGSTVQSAITSSSTTTSTTSTTTTTTTTKPTPKPAKGSAYLRLPDSFILNHAAVTVPGRRIHVQGIVHPYVRNQKVMVEAWLGHRLLVRKRMWIWPGNKRGSYGKFSQVLVAPGTGRVTVVASHDRNATLSGFRAARSYSALDTNIHFGSIGRFVQLMQQRLAAVHIFVRQTGVYDTGMGLALDAYHRLLGWGHSQGLDGKTISFLLNGWGEYRVLYPSHGHHAEGYLTRQLLVLADGSKVRWIFPISSGKRSTPTVLGNFHIYRSVPGYLPDGMYYSRFFIGGYAIHGYDPAPDYPASHGCMRTPIMDATFIYYWLNYGDAVDVYGSPPY
jgi:L,D-transpeptidase catalytic domain